MEKEYYSEYREIEEVHWWFLGRWRVIRSELDARLAPAPASRQRAILDFGSGTGAMVQRLAAYGTVIGIDVDEDAVRFCRERGLANVMLLGQLPLPFDDSSFDLVTAFDVIEHIDDDAAVLRELARVTKPDGMVMLTVPAYRFLWGAQDEISHHRRRYTARSLRRALDAGGLCVERLTYFNTLLFPPVAAVRVGRRLLRRHETELKSDFTMTRPGRVNALLASLFSLEAKLLRRLRMPFGVSILAVATPTATASQVEPAVQPALTGATRT